MAPLAFLVSCNARRIIRRAEDRRASYSQVLDGARVRKPSFASARKAAACSKDHVDVEGIFL